MASLAGKVQASLAAPSEASPQAEGLGSVSMDSGPDRIETFEVELQIVGCFSDKLSNKVLSCKLISDSPLSSKCERKLWRKKKEF